MTTYFFKSPDKEQAFSLLELLLVIGIVGVLAGLLVPTVLTARKSAKDALCLNQLRQIGGFLQLYVIENRGYLPNSYHQSPKGGFYWFQLLARYGGDDPKHHIEHPENVFRCPASQKRWRDGNQRFFGNYGWNISAGNQWNEADPSPQLIRYRRDDLEAGAAPVIADTNEGPYDSTFAIHWFSTGTAAGYLDARHQNGSAVHFLFADGSVRPVPQTEINTDFLNIRKHLRTQ
ncbi:MAG TPA: type II secretion system protein [Chthoniobacteraceae bacterium]|nr:type II secretion system protein [Chthoniobacteraceae bacterium]